MLPEINVENDFTKFEMIYCMQCLIHKYAKTDEDILRLQEMIGLKEAKIERMNILDKAEAKGEIRGEIRGEIKGEIKGSLNILNAWANDPKGGYTVEELADKFGFTVEEILNGK